MGEENETLIRSTAQHEQVLEEYRFEGEVLSGRLQDLMDENVDLQLGHNADKSSRGVSAVKKQLARAKGMKCKTQPKGGLDMRGKPLMRMRCAMREVWDEEADECA